jgi:hypothetical protein
MLHVATFYHETEIDGQIVEAIFEITARITPGEPAVLFGRNEDLYPGSDPKVDLLDFRGVNFDERHLNRIVAEYVADLSTDRQQFEFEQIDLDQWQPCFEDDELEHAIECQRKYNLFNF